MLIAGDERLLDRTTAGYQLLVGPSVGRRQCRRSASSRG